MAKVESSLRFYHGLVTADPIYNSDALAEQIASKVAEEIKNLGGSIDVGHTFGERPAILVVSLPESVTVSPSELVGEGIEFKEVHATVVPAVPDQGIDLESGEGEHA